MKNDTTLILANIWLIGALVLLVDQVLAKMLMLVIGTFWFIGYCKEERR
jgi:hypothetical protein